MTRDYKSHVNRKQKKSLPGFVWLLSGLAIGLFVAFIVYLDKQPENETDFGTAVQQELEKLKQQAKQGNETKSKEPSTEKPADKKEQKFNFYTILPELEVLIPESETRPPEVKKPGSSISSGSKPADSTDSTLYVLQVGSFQNLADAEKLKANLAFLGMQADIQKVVVNRQSWHRVRTGPYHDKQQLYRNQKLLKKNNIPAISMELK
jgi:cell division protein FtsN